MSTVHFKVRVVRVIRVTVDNWEFAKEAMKDIRKDYIYNASGCGPYVWEYEDGAKITMMRNKKGGRRGH